VNERERFLAEMAVAGFPEPVLRVWRSWEPVRFKEFVNALNASTTRRKAFRLAIWEATQSSRAFMGAPKMDPDERAEAGLATPFPSEDFGTPPA